MSDLEARIAEVLGAHLEHHGDEYDLRLSASIRKLGRDVAAMLAPVIAEAQAEAWDISLETNDAFIFGPSVPEPTNPYRADNLEKP